MADGRHADRGCNQCGSIDSFGFDAAFDIDGLRKRIIETVAKADVLQRRLDFDNEKRQLDADKREWQRRLAAMETELRVEPARIRDNYKVAVERIEPVGIVYLWPTTG